MTCSEKESATVKKTVFLPPDVGRAAEETAHAQCKTLSTVVQDGMRRARIERLREELGELQDCWSCKTTGAARPINEAS